MNPLVVLCPVAIADQRHNALGNADADMQGNGAALGGNT